MKEAIKLIKDFFDTEKWKYHYDEENDIFTTDINMNSVLGLLHIEIFVEEDCYLVYAQLQATTDKSYYEKIAEYLHRANYGLKWGNFELNYNDGKIRYKTFVDFENIHLSEAVIARSILMPAFMFKIYGEGLMKLMLGADKPQELIDDIEKMASQSEIDMN